MLVLENEKEITDAQNKFENVIAQVADHKVSVRITHPYGQITDDVYWLQQFNIWVYCGFPLIKEARILKKRHFNAFGFNKPVSSVSIKCEINFPKRGIDRRISGAFAKSSGGNIYLLHRGKFNAYRGGIPINYVKNVLKGNWVSALDGDKTSDFILIGRLDDDDFTADLVRFINEVHRLKNLYKQGIVRKSNS